MHLFYNSWGNKHDYTGEIKVLISLPTKTVQINKGQKIAQLLLLPYYQTRKTLTSEARGPRGFGSSDLAFWVQEITASRPLKDLLIQGNKMSGLLDTRADVSNIAGKDWPSSWPTRLTSAGLVGIGSVPSVAAAAAKSLQSCPTLCDPIDGSPPGSPVPGILQARILEWVAISF